MKNGKLNANNIKLFSKKYNAVVSLGEACFCASILTKIRLRDFSSPFDWLSGATFQKTCEIVANKFDRFIEIQDLEKIGERAKPEPCDIYHNKYNNITFNHDFPQKGNLNMDFLKVKNKYDRRISRLIEKLSIGSLLFVYMDDVSSTKSASEQDIKDNIQKIIDAYENNDIDLLYIKHNSSFKDHEYSVSQLSENAYLVELFNAGRDDNFNGNIKNCNPILKKIHLKRSLKDIAFKVSKTQARLRVYVLGIKVLSISLLKK